MLLYLLRHGETDYNNEGRFQGHLDMPLNETGLRQARLLARRMAAVTGVGNLYCSTLQRARVTAELVGEAMGLAPEPIDGIQEVAVGPWGGHAARELLSGPEGALVRRWLDGDAYFVVPGGESVAQVMDRAVNALRPRLDAAEADVAVVAHGVSLKALICGLVGLPIEYGRCFDLRNAGISVLRYLPGRGAKLLSLNDAAHLNEEIKPGGLDK